MGDRDDMIKPASVLSLLLAWSACRGSNDAQTRTGSASSPSAPVTQEHVQASDDMAEKMRHCPVSVPGVRTEIADVEGGVQLTLRASAPDAIAELRARAHRLAAGRDKGQHGGGRGGGFMRHCPIVVKDARVAVEDIDGGARITVRPEEAAKLAELRATSRERLERAPLERARVVREETSERGETRLYSGGVADLDGDGTLELIAGGFSTQDEGRRSTIIAYRQRGETWSPVAEAGWDGGEGSTVRNVEIADVDGDGKLEVIALGRVGATQQEARARLAVFSLENGRLVMRTDQSWLAGQYTHGYGLAIGDLDRDGRPEIVTGGFQFDGKNETGFVRVWSLQKNALVPRGAITLDGQGSSSMRINDLAIGDVDGDGRPELVVAGRHGPVKAEGGNERLDQRREAGDLSVLAFANDKLTTRARYSWTKGSSMRLRSVVVDDLDGDRRSEIVVGGQYDADGKQSLALFGFEAGKLIVRHDASSTAEGVTGEIKDLVVARQGHEVRVLATGVMGDKPGRQGDVAAWRLDHGKLVRDASVVSRNGEETRARAVVLVPTKAGSRVLTIGHARNKNAMIGQVLEWRLAGS
jgi:hypothetical protein